MLSDSQIELRCRNNGEGIPLVSHYAPGAIQPCSIDIRLGRTIKFLLDNGLPYDPITGTQESWERELDSEWEVVQLTTPDSPHAFVMSPGTTYLGVTMESFAIPSDLCALVHGASTLGRMGVLPHTAGLVDPGFRGRITMELHALNGPVKLYFGMKIGQVTFTPLDKPAVRAYNGNYQGDAGPGAPKLLKYTYPTQEEIKRELELA